MWLLLLLAACEAQIIGPGEGPFSGGNGGSIGTDLNPCGAQVVVGTAPMRRLSHDEYRNTLSDLQPSWASVVATQVKTFVQDSESLGFRNSAEFLDVKPVLAQEYMDAAEQVATTAVAGLTALLPCSPTNNEAPCAEQFIRKFGRQLYRRAL